MVGLVAGCRYSVHEELQMEISESVPPMSSNSTEKILASEEVLSQVIRDETVLLDLKTEQYYGLDDVGSRIWALIKEGAKREDIVTVLAGEYDVGEEILSRDIEQFIANLAEAGLLFTDKAASANP